MSMDNQSNYVVAKLKVSPNCIGGQSPQSSDNLKYKIEYVEKQTIWENKPKFAKKLSEKDVEGCLS